MPATTQDKLVKLLQESDGALMEVQAMDSLVGMLYSDELPMSVDLLNDIDSLCDKAISHLKAVKRITKGL